MSKKDQTAAERMRRMRERQKRASEQKARLDAEFRKYAIEIAIIAVRHGERMPQGDQHQLAGLIHALSTLMDDPKAWKAELIERAQA